MEEAALLAAVDLDVGAVDVEDEARGRRAGPGLGEEDGEQVLERLGVVADPVVAARLPLGGVLDPVERALAGQCGAVPAGALDLAGDEPQDGIVAQLVVVVQILVAQGEADDALGDEGVFGEARIPVVGEAGGDALEQARGSSDPAEQERRGIRGDRAAVE